MPVLFKIKKILLRHFMELRWHSVLLAIALYFSLSWVLLWLSGEQTLITNSSFVYWIVVTASTVGYGDLSPTTIPGKYTVAFFVIPFGLGLFGLAIGRVAAFTSFQWRKGIRGLKNLDYEGHILVIGWNEGRTLQLLKLLLRETSYHSNKQQIALCVRADIDNPLPDMVGFVKVASFSSDEDMLRAGVDKAGCIIIDNPEDDITMTTTLYCTTKNPSAHTIAYFQDDKLVTLLKQHCPNVECMPSVAVEMMAKSAVDPGSSALHHQLLNADEGMTQYSVKYTGKRTLPIRSFFTLFKESYEATLIGVSTDSDMTLNPSLETIVTPGSTIYYIADERINRIDWEAFSV
jgi:voltage-gated potassium channel